VAVGPPSVEISSSTGGVAATLHEIEVNGEAVCLKDDQVSQSRSLLEFLREDLGLTSPKDGCSPQGQCGCCTVWVDGEPRVACVTPLARVLGRSITTLEGLEPETRQAWAEAFVAFGASQCGFCSPGIIMRLEAKRRKGRLGRSSVTQALSAHLCRCTGWQGIISAATFLDEHQDRLLQEGFSDPVLGPRDFARASLRATLEGGTKQVVGPRVALGCAGFAMDELPERTLVAVGDRNGRWGLGDSLSQARARLQSTPGRHGRMQPAHPVELPEKDWLFSLRTTWVEPGYLEPDACVWIPGDEPRVPLANGGAFGGKLHSVVEEMAQRLSEQYQRPVAATLTREATVVFGPKRPPMALGIDTEGRFWAGVVATSGIEEVIEQAAMSLGWQVSLEQVPAKGFRCSTDLRAAGWAETTAFLTAWSLCEGNPSKLAHSSPWVTVTTEEGAVAKLKMTEEQVLVEVQAGDPLDEVTLVSYCTGAVHMGLSLVRSEYLGVSSEGDPVDLTIRSFGILSAKETPEIQVRVLQGRGPALKASDAVFAASLAAAWILDGLGPYWPTRC
jgi:xanthine dehydrogenase small subunit